MFLPVPLIKTHRSRIHSEIVRMFDTDPGCVVKTSSSVHVDDVVSIYYCRGSLGMWQLLPLVWSVHSEVG